LVGQERVENPHRNAVRFAIIWLHVNIGHFVEEDSAFDGLLGW
jgi:hypothetical protein